MRKDDPGATPGGQAKSHPCALAARQPRLEVLFDSTDARLECSDGRVVAPDLVCDSHIRTKQRRDVFHCVAHSEELGGDAELDLSIGRLEAIDPAAHPIHPLSQRPQLGAELLTGRAELIADVFQESGL